MGNSRPLLQVTAGKLGVGPSSRRTQARSPRGGACAAGAGLRAGGKFDTQKIRSQAARLFLRAGSPTPSETHPLWGLRTVGLEGDSPARGTSRGNRRPRVSMQELTRRVGTPGENLPPLPARRGLGPAPSPLLVAQRTRTGGFPQSPPCARALLSLRHACASPPSVMAAPGSLGGPVLKGEQAGIEPARRRPGLRTGARVTATPGSPVRLPGGGGDLSSNPEPGPPVTVGGPSRSPGPAPPDLGRVRRAAQTSEGLGSPGGAWFSAFSGFWRLCMAGWICGEGALVKLEKEPVTPLPVLCQRDQNFSVRNDSLQARLKGTRL